MLPKRSLIVCCILITALALTGCSRSKEVTAPVARVEPKADTLFGDVRVDDYHWLRERSDPRVLAYLEEENAHTAAVMKPTEKLQRALFHELKGRMVEADTSAPKKDGDYWYYTRIEEGQGYPVYCRKRGSLDAAEEILLDQNRLAEGHGYCQIGAFRPSPDHSLLAYSVDTTGAETYTVYIKDLQDGRLLDETISAAYDNVEWSGDGGVIYYSTVDPTLRPYRLYRHRMGTAQSEDELLFEEPDEMFYLELSKTRSRDYVLVSLESKTTSEVHCLDARRTDAPLRVILPRRSGVEYSVSHRGDTFYILTNDQAENFRLMQVPASNPSRAGWQEVIAHRPDVTLEGVDLFQNHLVVYQRQDGLEKIRIQNLGNGQVHSMDFPEPVYTFRIEENPEFQTALLRFRYSSLTTPRTVYDYHMDDRVWELKKYYRIEGGYDPSLYQSERIWASAPDGARIPISLVYRKGMLKNGSSPLYLYGYGAYGLSTDPGFSPHRLSLLDRGFVYAIAHVRGGGEMGRRWYLDGKLLNKMNTFTDFIACAKLLLAQGYTSSDRLVISGVSAGGLLAGAVTVMRPDLFQAVVAEVPFVDVLNTMLDPTIPLTVTEYEEWGDPHQSEYYYYMKQYSPYDHTDMKDYPHMLITAGLNDPRVQYWEPAKWTAKLRAVRTDDDILLLKTNMESGHFGETGRYDYLQEVAFEYAFIFHVLGIGK